MIIQASALQVSTVQPALHSLSLVLAANIAMAAIHSEIALQDITVNQVLLKATQAVIKKEEPFVLRGTTVHSAVTHQRHVLLALTTHQLGLHQRVHVRTVQQANIVRMRLLTPLLAHVNLATCVQ